ncbi:MAG TPA: hypothetical protein V6C76_10360 [Drouetiella sp.]
MGRSLVDMVKGMFYATFQGKKEEPVKARVENARMSSTRLKALKPIDYSKEPPRMPALATPLDPNDPKNISKRIKSSADMSHYRLEAYVASLPSEKSEIDKVDSGHLQAAG